MVLPKKIRTGRRKGRSRRITRRQRGGSSGPQQSVFFQDAYVITMPDVSDRWERMKPQATAAGIPLQSFPGVKVTPESVESYHDKGIGQTHYSHRGSPMHNLGAIGCFLAHRNLLKHIAETAPDKPGTLIFEDDVIIPPDFYSKLAAVAAEIPADWDYIFLDKLNIDNAGRMISPHIMKLDKDMTSMKNWGFWGFIVKNASIKTKILPLFEHMLDGIDMQLNKFADRVNLYLVKPSIIQLDHESASKSVIATLDTQK